MGSSDNYAKRKAVDGPLCVLLAGSGEAISQMRSQNAATDNPAGRALAAVLRLHEGWVQHVTLKWRSVTMIAAATPATPSTALRLFIMTPPPP